MSAQASYVYIPNLIGGQMLRIPVLDASDYDDLDVPTADTAIPDTPDATFDTDSLPLSREISSTSVTSADSVQESE